MCGIFGAIALGRSPSAGRAETVERGLRLIKHRGPDDDGVAAAGPAVLGHVRLSILDLEGGVQPMWDVARTGMISFNGEVYNFPDIRAKLEKAGRRFATRSDTEVVLNAFLEWGPRCLEELRGMFAFAAYDTANGRVLLARDRLGKKPLYYTVRDGVFYFSSELEALYRTVGPFPMDLGALDEYLAWQYISAPRTIYRGVHCLKPGHGLEVDPVNGEIVERAYWTLTFREDRSLDTEDWLRRLDELVYEAVKIRMVSDVPYGAFLSGGVDSSLIVGYMARILEHPVKTFTIGFHEAKFNEMAYARHVAETHRTEHHTEVVEADSLGLLPLLVRHYGQPFADSSAVPSYYVSRLARKYVKMVLSGDGGDENFAGYNSYEYVLRELGGSRVGASTPEGKRRRRLGRFYLNLFQPRPEGSDVLSRAYALHCVTAYHFYPEERRALFQSRFRAVVHSEFPERKAWMAVGPQPVLSSLQNLDIHAYLPFDILVKVDIVSMANSLEVRVPLLDHRVVETAASLPSELKIAVEKCDGGVGYEKKYALKRLSRKFYSPEFIDRPKMGFGLPLGAWFAGKLRPIIEEKLLGSEYLKEFFESEEIRGWLARHSETNDYSARIWNLLFLEEWMRSHPEALPGI
jgi:asparagine synthase (glutamine-hydrolysing)